MRTQGILVIFCLFFGGCAVGPDFEAPPAPVTAQFMESELPVLTVSTTGEGGAAQVFVLGGDIPGQWWDLFRSQHINDLIKKGIKNNNSLQAAQAALRAADANYRASIGNLFPFISAGANASRLKVNGSAGGSSSSPRTFNLFAAGLNVAYTLDVFGGIRRQIESDGALVDFKDYEEKATYLTLTGNIVATSIIEASLREQIKATNELIKLQENNLDISRKRYNLGAISQIDVLAQETQLSQTKATLPPLQDALAKTRTTLSVLIGELPSESKLATILLSQISLPVKIPVSVPSSLVKQRPDVKAAEALLHAASAQIGVATANLLPQLTLSANYGGSANVLKDLFKDSANVWSVLGNIAQPIFKGGTLLAQREVAIANFEQAYAEYRQVVLEAYQNVADILYSLEQSAQQLKISTESERAATETLKMVQTQYDLGAVSYLNLTVALLQYHTARINKIRAHAARLSDTVALFQALGGGWWNSATSVQLESGDK